MALIYGLLPAFTVSAPLPTGKPHWINPCDLPEQLLDPNEDFDNLPPISKKDLVSHVIEAANTARKHAGVVKNQFLETYFPDEEFNVDYMRQHWLPEVPPTTFGHFKSMNISGAYKQTFEFMQYYAVGVEEMRLDQDLHPESGATFQERFQEIQFNARTLLCNLQFGMINMKIKQNPDILRQVMQEEYRNIEEESRRNLRDFIILRDYVKTVTYIWELFTYILNNQLLQAT
ncbi:uncharacterized protein LOC143253143 isoform X2 [Tachypleus tridentatus]